MIEVNDKNGWNEVLIGIGSVSVDNPCFYTFESSPADCDIHFTTNAKIYGKKAKTLYIKNPLLSYAIKETFCPVIDEVVTNVNSKKKAILVAGQSNTLGYSNFGKYPVDTGELDLGIKQLARHNSDDLIPANAGLSNIHFQQADRIRLGYAYPLAKKIKDSINCNEILIIPCADGGTGWADNNWTAESDLYQDMIARIRYTIDVLDYEIVGVFWSQGEKDTNSIFKPIWHHILHGLVSTIRSTAFNAGQPNAHEIPFVTFDMVEGWVGSNENRRAIQNALENIGNIVPFTGNTDTTGMPDNIDSDAIHYDTRQQIELGNRMFMSWQNAKINDVQGSYALPSETIIYHRDDGNQFANSWAALQSGDTPTDAIYSRLGEIWRYENNGKYRFKLEWVVGSTTHNAVFEQNFIPHFTTDLMSAASLISHSDGAIWGDGGATGFTGITYHSDKTKTFLKFSNGHKFFFPIGQVAPFSRGIPISNSIFASSVTLTVIKI